MIILTIYILLHPILAEESKQMQYNSSALPWTWTTLGRMVALPEGLQQTIDNLQFPRQLVNFVD